MGTGDIYSDLLKIAETAIEEYPKALFKGKVVEVIQQGPATGLSRIREEGREFSTKTVNLIRIEFKASLSQLRHISPNRPSK